MNGKLIYTSVNPETSDLYATCSLSYQKQHSHITNVYWITKSLKNFNGKALKVNPFGCFKQGDKIYFNIEDYERKPTWGVFKDIYCAGNDSVFTFLEDVLSEVTELFPSEYVHIGGDEAPKYRWENCKKCQKRINQNKLKDEHKNEAQGQRILNKLLSFNPLLSNVSNLGKKAIDAHHVSHWHEKKLDKVVKKDTQPEQEENEPTN